MRILRLDLLAFGHFTNVALDLSADPGTIHLVYGPNEAGKSTALRALRALFYGVDTRSPDNFLHDHSRLRVGAVVQRADGTTIDFIRRKGNKNTFLDRAGNPADDAPLRTALSAVGEDLFTSLFGLDYGQLVAGGHGILRAGGEVGASLFSAGVGGVSLRDVLEKLEGEAAELFKPQGQNQVINQACRRYREARDKVAAHSLLSRDYDERFTARAGLNQTRDQVAAEARNLRLENHRLERIARALPLLAARRALTEELAAIGPVPALPEGFSERRSSAGAALDAGRQQREANEGQIADLAARLDRLSVPETLLARDQSITDLHQRLGSHLKAAGDLPALYAELRTLEKAAARLRGELGLGEAESPRLSRGSRQKVQSLAGRHRELVGNAAAAGRGALGLARDLQTRREEWQALPDVTALRDAVQEVQRRGDLEEELAGRRLTLRSAETGAAEALQRLDLWRGTLAELAVFAAPTAETIDRFEKSWLAAQDERSQNRARQQEAGARLGRCEREMETMLRAGSVPSEAELAAARARREEHWRAVRHAWLEAPGAADAPGPLAAAYEEAVQRTDDLADRLRREAERVAQHAHLAVEADDLARQLRGLQDEAARQETAWQQLEEEWRVLWPAISPRPPREMRAWVQRQERLVAQADGLRDLREAVAAAEARIAEYRARLAAHLPPMGESPLRALVAQGVRLVNRADLLARDLEKLTADAKTADAAQAAADAALADWQTAWREAMLEIGRAETTHPEEAVGFIEGCVELQGQTEQADRLRVRIRAIRSDADKFEVEAAAIFAQLSPERAVPKAEEAIGELYARLNRARQDATTRTELTKQHADAVAGLQRAQQIAAEAESTLAGLCQQAGCDAVGQLEAVEQRSREAAARRAKLDQLNERLSAESAGVALEDFVAAIEALDADQVLVEMSENQRRLHERDEHHTRLSTEIGGLDRDLKAMDGNARAGEAAEEAQSILAQLEEHTERFIRLKLAATILRREIEDYRVKNQSPLLARASDFFRRLTIGSFRAVATDFDEEDNPVLEGVRATGQRVRVESLSDGTRDQLFLALKLASVEQFIADCEPMPFIVDDVLVAFDHEREAAVLEALRELAGKTQVILFTHHRHLVELAGRILGGAVKVHDLDAQRKAAVANPAPGVAVAV